MTLVFLGVTPFGSLFMGSLVDYVGAPAGWALGGALGLASTVVVAWRFLGRHKIKIPCEA